MESVDPNQIQKDIFAGFKTSFDEAWKKPKDKSPVKNKKVRSSSDDSYSSFERSSPQKDGKGNKIEESKGLFDDY